jgi:hypothetical protein
LIGELVLLKKQVTALANKQVEIVHQTIVRRVLSSIIDAIEDVRES